MSNRLLGLSALVGVAFFLSVASAAELKSGPLHPLNCTGDHAGEKYCLYCKYGDDPVAAIFARHVTPELTKLVKKIDQATEKNRKRNMGSFVVFLSDSDALEAELKQLAKKEKLEHCILAIDHPAGPEGYNIAQEAEVTVVLYTKLTVQANHTFKTGELNDKRIGAIVAGLTKMLRE